MKPQTRTARPPSRSGPARKIETAPPKQAAVKPVSGWNRRILLRSLVVLAVFIAAYCTFWPAMHGEFVFDDLHLPFAQPAASTWPIKLWLTVRPVTQLSYWANLHVNGLNPYGYHVVNVAIHALAALLLFFALRRILEFAHVQARTSLALFAAGVFLLHPMQTESVAYIAGRSETLAALFFFAAWCIFLYRRSLAVSWAAAGLIILLFLAALASKEHAVTLPALLLLTDYFWNPPFSFEGVKRNWRLYAPLLAGGLAGGAVILRYISKDVLSIGFNLPEFTWYQYLFTQFRVFWIYIYLFLFPRWQTVDYDLPVSRRLLDNGAVFGMLGIVALILLAWMYRKRFPLAAYGFLVFTLLLLPTSSVVPIKDVIVDRRLYLPMTGLLLVALEFLRRWNVPRRVLIASLAAVCLICAIWSYNRSSVFSSSYLLWSDAVEKAPRKQRPLFGLAVAQLRANKCKDAAETFSRAASVGTLDYTMAMDWGLAYSCSNEPAKGIEKMQQSIALKPSAQSWASLALIEARQGKVNEPLADLDRAQTLEPMYPQIYLYRGGILEATGESEKAEAQYRHVLLLDPTNTTAQAALARLRSQSGR